MKVNKLTPGFNMQWESMRMMLPEHVQALRDRKEEMKKVEKPMLDDQELQEIGIVVMDSLRHELDVAIVYWEDGFFKRVVGVVDRVDMQQMRIKVKIKEDYGYIDIDCLKSVERTETN